jgi:hypothetical protein
MLKCFEGPLHSRKIIPAHLSELVGIHANANPLGEYNNFERIGQQKKIFWSTGEKNA